MSDIEFLFGLDNIIIKEDLMTGLARSFGIINEIEKIRKIFSDDKVPFRTSFLKYIEKFKDVPLTEIRRTVMKMERNDLLYKFITDHKNRCYIISGHLDLWTNELLEETGACYYTSKASERNGYLNQINCIMDKTSILRKFKGSFAAVGNSNNDVEMIAKSKIGIGYGGISEISSSVLNYASHAVFDEQSLYYFLNQLL